MKKTAIKSISLLLLFAVLCGSLSACSSTVKDAALRIPLAAEPKGLDPQIAQGSDSATVVANCYEGLLRLNERGEVVPAAASSVSVSGDGLTYTFALHNNCKWHINTNHKDIFGDNYETAIDLRVTAADFVYGLQRALDPQTRAPDARRLYMIKNAATVNAGKASVATLGVKAVNEFTVQITLEYTSSEFLQMLTEPIAMPCCRAFFEATKGKYGLTAATVLCNGPFYLSRWYPDSNILLRRNPDSHAPAKPESVTFAFTTDEDIILSNLTDEIYACAPLTALQVETAKAAGLQTAEIKNSIWGLIFNCSDETMRSNKIRIALCKATDFTEIRNSANGLTPATSIVPPSCTVEGKPFTEAASALGTLAYDEKKAQQFYNDFAGDDMCSVTVLCSKEYETAVRKIIQNWQRLFGISLSAKVEAVEEIELEQRVATGKYQCAFAQIKTDAQSPVEFLYSFKDGGNACKYTSGNFNTLLDQLLKANGTPSVVEGCMKAQTYLIQNAVICPLFYRSTYFGAQPKAKNIGFVHSGKTVLLSNVEMSKN